MKRLLIALTLALTLWASSAEAAFSALLQHTYNSFGTGGSSVVGTLGSNPTTGNVVAVGGFVWNNIALTPTITISDGNGNTYTKSPNSPSTGDPTGAGYAYSAYFIATGTAEKTITVTSSRVEIVMTVWVAEVTVTGGTASFDNDATGSGASGTTINTPTIPVAGTSELVVSYAAPDHAITAVGGAWTAIDTIPSTLSDGGAYILSVSAGTAVNFTQSSSGGWSSMGMSFAFTPSGGTTTCPTLTTMGVGRCG